MTIQDHPTAVAELAAGPVEYRLERRGDTAVILFHGGHMRAGLPLGEDVFASLGHTLLTPSRPGYGRTPLKTAATPSDFADATRELCAHLGIDRVAAVVGVSAGGRSALALAARHPDLVERLILKSAVGPIPWPDRRTRVAAHIAFNPVVEKAAWVAVRALMRLAPTVGLKAMMSSLSTEPAGGVLAGLSREDRAGLVALFSRMRSGNGFINDLRGGADLTREITQPTLIIASRKDGSVPFEHAEALLNSVSGAELIVSEAESHLLWYSDDYPDIAEEISSFLDADPPRKPPVQG